MTSHVLSEEEKMQRVPGIIFVDGATGRRPHAEGTGLDVFEIIKIYRGCDEDWECLKAALYWLPEDRLRAALLYTQTFPDDVMPRVLAEESLRPEDVYAQYPFMNPNR